MKQQGMKLKEALALLVYELRRLEERRVWEEERQHLEYPIWLYGQDR